jgi:hypothetical protein
MDGAAVVESGSEAPHDQATDAAPEASDATADNLSLEATTDSPTEGLPTDGATDAPRDAWPQEEASDVRPSWTFLTTDAGLLSDPSCSGVPPDSFGYLPGSEECYQVSGNGGQYAAACFSNLQGTDAGFPLELANSIAVCTEIAPGGPCTWSRHGTFCCAFTAIQIDGLPYLPGDCAVLFGATHLAYGKVVDTDMDNRPDLIDNCPYVSNPVQLDWDQDGFGNECDNCPYTYNPDQAAATDGGIGNACNCALPGVAVGPNGCPCTDGGAGSSVDGGGSCGLVVFADGGVLHL